MYTTHYTITAREVLLSGDGVREAAGGARQLVCLRQSGGGRSPKKGDNVIDLAAWRADRGLEEPEGPAEAEAAHGPVRRPRRAHGALMKGEWLATLSVVVVMAVLLVKIISF